MKRRNNTLKSLLIIKSSDKLLTVVYDHDTKEFTPDVEHDENCLRIIDNAIVESQIGIMLWPDFDDLSHVREYRRKSPPVKNITWFEDNHGTPEDKLMFLSFLSKVRVDIDDNGKISFIKDRGHICRSTTTNLE